MSVGLADGSNPGMAPGSDGNGTGVPQNSVIQNVTQLANAVAQDVAGVYRTVNSPPPAVPYTYGQPGISGIGGISIFPLLLIGIAFFLVLRK